MPGTKSEKQTPVRRMGARDDEFTAREAATALGLKSRRVRGMDLELRPRIVRVGTRIQRYYDRESILAYSSERARIRAAAQNLRRG